MSGSIPLVYIGGPMTADTSFSWAKNCLVGLQASVEVMKAGCAVHCPLLQGLFMQNDFEYDEIIRLDLEVLGRCDCLLLVGDWSESKGALAEQRFAYQNGILVYGEIEDMLRDMAPREGE